MCGSDAALERAVARGAVAVVHDDAGGPELYYFPNKSWGTKEQMGHKQQVEKSKQTTSGAYDTLSAFIANAGWTVKTSQRALEADTKIASVRVICRRIHCVNDS